MKITKALLITALPLLLASCAKNSSLTVNENIGAPSGATFVPLNIGALRAGSPVGAGNVTVSISCPNGYIDGSTWSQTGVATSSSSTVEVMTTNNGTTAVTCTVTLTSIILSGTTYNGSLAFPLPTTGTLNTPAIATFTPSSGPSIFLGGVPGRTGTAPNVSFTIDLDYSSSLSDLSSSLSSTVNGTTATVTFTQEGVLAPTATGLTIQKNRLNNLEGFSIGGTFSNFSTTSSVADCRIIARSGSNCGSGSTTCVPPTYASVTTMAMPSTYALAQTAYNTTVNNNGVYNCASKLLAATTAPSAGVSGGWGYCTVSGGNCNNSNSSGGVQADVAATPGLYRYDWFVVMRNADTSSGISSYTVFAVPKQTFP